MAIVDLQQLQGGYQNWFIRETASSVDGSWACCMDIHRNDLEPVPEHASAYLTTTGRVYLRNIHSIVVFQTHVELLRFELMHLFLRTRLQYDSGHLVATQFQH